MLPPPPVLAPPVGTAVGVAVASGAGGVLAGLVGVGVLVQVGFGFGVGVGVGVWQ